MRIDEHSLSLLPLVLYINNMYRRNNCTGISGQSHSKKVTYQSLCLSFMYFEWKRGLSRRVTTTTSKRMADLRTSWSRISTQPYLRRFAPRLSSVAVDKLWDTITNLLISIQITAVMGSSPWNISITSCRSPAHKKHCINSLCLSTCFEKLFNSSVSWTAFWRIRIVHWKFVVCTWSYSVQYSLIIHAYISMLLWPIELTFKCADGIGSPSEHGSPLEKRRWWHKWSSNWRSETKTNPAPLMKSKTKPSPAC